MTFFIISFFQCMVEKISDRCKFVFFQIDNILWFLQVHCCCIWSAFCTFSKVLMFLIGTLLLHLVWQFTSWMRSMWVLSAFGVGMGSCSYFKGMVWRDCGQSSWLRSVTRMSSHPLCCKLQTA